jgi:hypothetical protein
MAAMKQYSKGLAVLLITAFLWFPAGIAAEEVYSWVDENGVRHYGDMPPDREDAEVLQLQEIPAMSDTPPRGAQPLENSAAPPEKEGELTAAQQRREDIKRQQKESREARAEKQKLCNMAQSRLAAIEPHRRVYFTNDKGETERMDDEQRVGEVESLHEYLDKNCK